jgi:large subunit ribosomal protein L3
MITTFFAKKTGMTGKYDEKRERFGTTILSVLPMQFLDSRTSEKHGYRALRFKIENSGFKNGQVREIRTEEIMEPGTEIKFEEMVKPGDRVTISGISKGKGFSGVVKKYHFKGGPRTHGQSDRERAPGSSGSTTTPGRVYKGKRRASRKGTEKVTIRNLRVLEVNAEKRLMTVIGSVPGANNYTLLTIKKV